MRCFRLGERFGNDKLTYNGNVGGCRSVMESGGAKEAVTLSVKNLDLKDGHACVLGQRQADQDWIFVICHAVS